MSFSPARRTCLCAFVLPFFLISCHKAATGPPPHYAFLRFENLSGDPALEWVCRAASESLPVMLAKALDGPVLQSSSLGTLAAALGGRPASAPGISSERAEAILGGASRVITGYLERYAGQIRITATEEDTATHQSLRIVTATAGSPEDALDRLAHDFSPNAGPPPTANPEALRDFAIALETPAGMRAGLLDQAIQIDPTFGQAWFALANLYLARGDRAAVETTVERARQQKLTALSRANVEFVASELSSDRMVKIAALRSLVDLNRADGLLLRTLADTEIAAGQFDAAAKDWSRFTAAFPGDPLAWNSLGYARSYAGDYGGALAAFREYERLHPREANPSDSMGDLNYSFRKFRDAATNYLEAHKKQPGFDFFADLYKAAWAKFRAGDPRGADSLFSQFRSERLKARPSDELVELLAADWLYRTGRQSEADATVHKLIAETKSAVVRVNAWTQLTIWDFLRNDRARAARDAAAIGPGLPSAAAFIVRFAAQPSASADEWAMRADRITPQSAGGLHDLALGYALLFDGKREAAIPVWARIANAAPATDFFTRAIYTRLQGRTTDRPLLPNPINLNEFAAVLDKL